MKVVYSEEVAAKPKREIKDGARIVPSSISFVPPVAGLIAAGEAIKTLIAERLNENGEDK